jgi:hypothetical protein
MKDTADDAYPGAAAAADEVRRLADEYREAFLALRATCRKGHRVSYLPARFCALHAIELYLGSFLRHQGVPAKEVRGKNHDLSALAAEAQAKGLALTGKRMKCLARVSAHREYLLYRYEPSAPPTLEQINSIEKTLEDIASAVRDAVK